MISLLLSQVFRARLAMEAILIDAFEFCRIADLREGEFSMADLPRLTAEAVNTSGNVRWSLRGGYHAQDYPQLTLSVSGEVQLMCQRCLKPYTFELAAESKLLLTQDEEAADALEVLLDDEALDVIVGSRQLNVGDLVEDEALLALPVSPRHTICPDQADKEIQVSGDKPLSAFGALKDWKR